MKEILFTAKEIEALMKYLKPDGRTDIDGFLSTISSDSPGIRIPDFVKTGTDLRNFMGQIEDLYTLLCKYGSTHEIPSDAFTLDVDDKFGDGKGGLHIEPRFKSLSVNNFYGKNDKNLNIIENKSSRNGYQPLHIPFVDVGDLLGEEAGDGILLGPNQGYVFRDKKIRNDLGVNPREEIVLEDKINAPRFSEKKHGISDAELDVCVDYLRNPTADFSPEEFDYIRKMVRKIKGFVDSRFETIRSMTMDTVLQVGDTITPEGMEHTDYLKKISDFMGTIPPPETLITYGDLSRDERDFRYLKSDIEFKSGSSFESLTELRKRGFVPMPENRRVSVDDLKALLDVGKQSGNRAVVELLASKGLVQDEVLSVGNTITPLGMQHASFLQYEVGELTPEERKDVVVTRGYMDDKLHRLNYEIIEKPESYDYLVEKGMSFIIDDRNPRVAKHEPYAQLSAINSSARLPSILEDTEGFLGSMLHSLGIEEEQVRPDKDDYIK